MVIAEGEKTYHNKNRLKKIHDYLLALKGFLKESFQLKKISTFVVLKEIANHIRIEHKQIKNKKTHKNIVNMTLELVTYFSNESILVIYIS